MGSEQGNYSSRGFGFKGSLFSLLDHDAKGTVVNTCFVSYLKLFRGCVVVVVVCGFSICVLFFTVWSGCGYGSK